MATYTIEIPDGLHREIQERRHRIDVAGICEQALSAAVTRGQEPAGRFQFGRDVAEDINRMYNG